MANGFVLPIDIATLNMAMNQTNAEFKLAISFPANAPAMFDGPMFRTFAMGHEQRIVQAAIERAD